MRLGRTSRPNLSLREIPGGIDTVPQGARRKDSDMTTDIDTGDEFEEEECEQDPEQVCAALESAAESWSRGGVRAYQVASYGPGNGLSGVVIQLAERRTPTCSACGSLIEAVECVDCLDPTTGEVTAQYDHSCCADSAIESIRDLSAYELGATDADDVIGEMAREMAEEVGRGEAAYRAKLVDEHERTIAALADGGDPSSWLDGSSQEDDDLDHLQEGTYIDGCELVTWHWAWDRDEYYEMDDVRTGFKDLPAAARTALLRYEFQDDPEELKAWLAEYPSG